MNVETLRAVVTGLMWITVPGSIASVVLMFTGTRERNEFFWHVVTYSTAVALLATIWATARLMIDYFGGLPGWYAAVIAVSFILIPVAVYWRLSLQIRSLLHRRRNNA